MVSVNSLDIARVMLIVIRPESINRSSHSRIILTRCLQGLHSFGKCATIWYEFFYDYLTFTKRGQVVVLF